MEILKADAAMLSNYEVLTLLNEQKTQRLANEVAGTREVAENLRTVEFEVRFDMFSMDHGVNIIMGTLIARRGGDRKVMDRLLLIKKQLTRFFVCLGWR